MNRLVPSPLVNACVIGNCREELRTLTVAASDHDGLLIIDPPIDIRATAMRPTLTGSASEGERFTRP